MRPSEELLIRPRTAIGERDHLVFVEAVPWRTDADASAARAETIPGAHRAGIRERFAGAAAPGTGHLPLPDAESVRAAAVCWRGDRPERRIVVFARNRTDLTSATRAWFVLSWAGVGGVSVMLGGLADWRAEGGPLGQAAHEATGAIEATVPGTNAHGPWPVRTISASELASITGSGTVLDGRPAEHYAGFLDDPRSGHVPGAVSAPATELLAADGSLRPPRELRRWFLTHGAIGGHRVAAYCHGGVASSSLVFSAALLGQPIDLYVDSWSAWVQNPSLPVAHGSKRGRTSGGDFSCFDPLPPGQPSRVEPSRVESRA